RLDRSSSHPSAPRARARHRGMRSHDVRGAASVCDLVVSELRMMSDDGDVVEGMVDDDPRGVLGLEAGIALQQQEPLARRLGQLAAHETFEVVGDAMPGLTEVRRQGREARAARERICKPSIAPERILGPGYTGAA